MGMAASQARYLALTARKSNVEYEGQQINQSRTALANQSANLFSQMLNMAVPTPPSTADYTSTQYTFKDGSGNDETLSNYYQLGTSDSDYNYVVTTYHDENVYTGSRKKLKEPQVQGTKTDHYNYDAASLDQNKSTSVSKAWKNTDGTYGMETTDGTTTIYNAVTAAQDAQVRALNAGNGVYQEIGATPAKPTVNTTDATVKAGFTAVKSTDKDAVAQIKSLYGVTTVADDAYYSNGSGGYIVAADYTTPNATADLTEGQGVAGTNPAAPSYYTDGTTYVAKSDLDTAVTTYNSNVANGTKNTNTINEIKPENDATYSNYTAVGNSALTELNASDLADEDTKTEIDQIIKDMKTAKNGDTTSAENLAACFTTDASGNTTYTGGIYKFVMGGTTYYTTQKDLASSSSSALAPNNIDNQQSPLSYYSASNVSQKVEDTQKALLETDSSGRFKSVKLADDSVTYSLSSTTTTNEAAYNDAMNSYYYNKSTYEKSVSDINAKTEIIQTQDKTLELRLEQLNTEQSALQNEMEAVKKVVDKHVELGFKTFGG